MAAHDLATPSLRRRWTTPTLRTLPDGVSASRSRSSTPATSRIAKAAKDVITANDVPLLCRQIGGSRYDGVVRALARSKMTSPSKNRRTTETPRNDAGEALASLRVAELEKIADGCATATEPRDDDSVRGYWLSKNWAQHLRRYYEQSRAAVESFPERHSHPKKIEEQLGRARPCGPTRMRRFSASTAFCAPRRVRDRLQRVLVSRRRGAPTGTVPARRSSRRRRPPSLLAAAWNRHGAFACSWRGDGGSPTHCLIAQVCSASRTARKLERGPAAAGRQRLERLRGSTSVVRTGGRNPRSRPGGPAAPDCLRHC